MISDSKQRLKDIHLYVHDKVFINGFSASGSFVNRFTALHPEIVQAVAVGCITTLVFTPLIAKNG